MVIAVCSVAAVFMLYALYNFYRESRNPKHERWVAASQSKRWYE